MARRNYWKRKESEREVKKWGKGRRVLRRDKTKDNRIRMTSRTRKTKVRGRKISRVRQERSREKLGGRK